jgi:threonylcarbamoyladenosine tRNA methylthiotransferase MtaB
MKSVGCRTNQSELDSITRSLDEIGLTQCQDFHEADFSIINTCAVTRESEKKSLDVIRRVWNAGNSFLLLTGCCVEAGTSELPEDSNRVKLFSNSAKGLIVDEVFKIASVREHAGSKRSAPDHAKSTHLHSRPIIKIQEGCSCFCSYCVVPFLRGTPRSIGYDDIKKEIERSIFEFPCEIVLTGTNIGLFRDPASGLGLAQLMQRILEEFPHVYIRLSSIELNDIDDELIRLFEHDRVRNHLHIPLQSASDFVLARMGRNYSYENYRRRVLELKKLIPGIGITTDVMVGFPGESDEDFEMTCKAVAELEFLKIHVFRYSSRAGTRAARFDGQIPEGVKSRRSRQLINMGEEIGLNCKRRFLGQILSCTAEKRLKDEVYLGTSQNYIKLLIRGNNIKEGMVLNCLVKKEEGDRFVADFVDE